MYCVSMPSVDDVAGQICHYLEKRPTADFAEIASGIGRAKAFVQAICKLRNIVPAPPLPVGYNPRTDSRRKIIGATTQVRVHDFDYCDELLKFQKWTKNREFNFKLGMVFAMRLFA